MENLFANVTSMLFVITIVRILWPFVYFVIILLYQSKNLILFYFVILLYINLFFIVMQLWPVPSIRLFISCFRKLIQFRAALLNHIFVKKVPEGMPRMSLCCLRKEDPKT